LIQTFKHVVGSPIGPWPGSRDVVDHHFYVSAVKLWLGPGAIE
jgi:hypothetical protein